MDKVIATFLLSQLEGHARIITMPFMGRGSDMLKELRKKCNHLTPQLKLEMYQRQLSLNQSKKELASHYLARWKNSWINGTQLDAFNIPEQQAIDMALSGMNYFLPMYTNLISTFLAQRQLETNTDTPPDKCLTYTALEDAFIDLDTKITSKQKSFDNINYASTNTNITCHYCGKQGHIERDCRKKKRDQQGNSNQRKNGTSQQNYHQTRHYGNSNNNKNGDKRNFNRNRNWIFICI